jgi:dipeptidyl aminopeptidase/acylaminoacyl peptidase
MADTAEAPYGAWRSPITADLIVAGTVGLNGMYVDGNDIYWTESRPTEGGRVVVVRRTADGAIADITPAPYNVRSRVHEYGGGAYCVHHGTVFFSNFSDTLFYRQDPGQAPTPLTRTGAMRYADPIVDQRRGRLILVREDHSAAGKEPVNTLVSLALDGGSERVLASGHDFYAHPRLSPDGATLAWLAWNHPNMPWDGTELWVAPIQADGSLGPAERAAGGEKESIFQPEWSPDGRLYLVSDRTGWWNLYRLDDGHLEALCPMEAEFGEPLWVFGMGTYAFLSTREVICVYVQGGRQHIARLDVETGEMEEVGSQFCAFGPPRVVGGDRVVCVVGSATEPTAVASLDLASGAWTILRSASEVRLDPGYVSVPEAIDFQTEGGLTAHGFYYAPHNKDFEGQPGERPPLLVKSHGGPTGATDDCLDLEIQYWTSRGFAVLDVNYGGSTGYGRAYRERLDGQWGVVDVDDCVNGARYLAEKGLADPARLAIDGGSAGGYTTLCALTFRDVFKAGASYYGISDAAALAAETHKFESRYSDRLIGPYPAALELYRERSPIHFIERMSCALILFQGLDDKVVPPNQAEMMYEAVKARGLPVAYLPFEGEGHGFRKAENIKRSLEAELYFFGRVFGFTPADTIEPLPIANA